MTDPEPLGQKQAAEEPNPSSDQQDAAADLQAGVLTNDTASKQQQSQQRTWESRVQKKCRDLRSMFELPEDESPIEDYHCALHKKLLLQGRLYIFQQHICFYSNLFGYVSKRVIKLQEVTSISKRKHIGFPNSIEIVHDGKHYFFTSFLHRREAYSQIICAWLRCSPHAEQWREPISSAGSKSSPGSSFSRQGSLASAASGADFGNQPMPDEEDDLLDSPEQQRVRLRADASSSKQPYRMFSTPEATSPTGRKIRQRSVSWGPRDAEFNSEAAQVPASPFAEPDPQASPDGRDDVPDMRQPSGEWAAEAGAAPALQEGMQQLLDGQLDIHLEGFCHRFLADGATFLQQFHESRGDSEVRLSSWTRHAGLGHVRELHFSSPVKALIGPPQAECHQTQRYHMYKGPHLVLETSQSQPNIPFGECFTVEARWDITPVPHNPAQCHVTTHISIPFSKSTWWKKAIEKGSMESCREAHADWLAKAQALLEGPQARGPSMDQGWQLSGPMASYAGSVQAEVDEVLGQLPVQHRRAVADVIRRASQGSLPASSPRAQLLDYLDKDTRMSSDKIPHARLSKTTRFSDAVFQQGPQLSGVTSITGAQSGFNIDPATPAKLSRFPPLPGSISLLLVLAGVIIGFQVAIVLGLVSRHDSPNHHAALFPSVANQSDVFELQRQLAAMQQSVSDLSQVLSQKGMTA